MLKWIPRVGGLAVVFGCMAAAAFAQGGSATFSGTVFDRGKAVLPGVSITVTNEATGITREAVTGPEGQSRRRDQRCLVRNEPERPFTLPRSLPQPCQSTRALGSFTIEP